MFRKFEPTAVAATAAHEKHRDELEQALADRLLARPEFAAVRAEHEARERGQRRELIAQRRAAEARRAAAERRTRTELPAARERLERARAEYGQAARALHDAEQLIQRERFGAECTIAALAHQLRNTPWRAFQLALDDLDARLLRRALPMPPEPRPPYELLDHSAQPTWFREHHETWRRLCRDRRATAERRLAVFVARVEEIRLEAESEAEALELLAAAAKPIESIYAVDAAGVPLLIADSLH